MNYSQYTTDSEKRNQDYDILWSFLDAAVAHGATPHQLDVIIQEYAHLARQGDQKRGTQWTPK